MVDFSKEILRNAPTSYFNRPGATLPVFVAGSVGSTPQGPRSSITNRGHGARRPVVGAGTGSAKVFETFYDLFWKGRLHLIETTYSAGNVLSPEQNSFEIYNAGVPLADATITGLTEVDTDGFTIIAGNQSFPYSLGIGESETYTYEIGIDGPGTITASYTFARSVGGDLVHTVTGTRIVIFNFEPQYPVVERWAWSTDIMESVDGNEQRQSLRDYPAQSWLLRYRYGDETRNMGLENYLTGHSPRQVALTLHVYRMKLTSAAAINDTTINVDSTDEVDIRVGNDILLVNLSNGTVESRQVDAFTSTTIDLNTGLLNAFSQNDHVFPIFPARMSNPLTQNLWANNAREVQAEFRVEVNTEFADESGFTLYRGFPVWTATEDMLLDNIRYQRQIDAGTRRFDSGTGLFSDSSGKTIKKSRMGFAIEMPTTSEFWRIKRFLHARRGRQKMFWICTNRQDFSIGADQTAGQLLQITHVNYTPFVFDTDTGNRRDIEIEYVDGSIDRREITAAVQLTSALEQLTLGSPSSQDLTEANVARISFLLRVRLDIDTVDLIHEHSRNIGFTNVAVIEVLA